jgi:hypothetical protein
MPTNHFASPANTVVPLPKIRYFVNGPLGLCCVCVCVTVCVWVSGVCVLASANFACQSCVVIGFFDCGSLRPYILGVPVVVTDILLLRHVCHRVLCVCWVAE